MSGDSGPGLGGHGEGPAGGSVRVMLGGPWVVSGPVGRLGGPGCFAQAGERLGEGFGPGPVLIGAQDEAPSGSDEPAGDVEHVVAQPLGFDLA